MIYVERYHDISCGHRVVGHETKCRYLHGHNYRFYFRITGNELDKIGRVIDFGVIKETLCAWLESIIDHKFLVWEKDPLLPKLKEVSEESLCVLPFNPTAENIAEYMVRHVGPKLLEPYGVKLVSCRVDETSKCSVTVDAQDYGSKT